MRTFKNSSSRFVMSLAALLVVSALAGCKKKEAETELSAVPAVPAIPASAAPSATGAPSPTATGTPSPTATGTPSPTATGATGTPGAPAPAPTAPVPAGSGGDVVSVLGQPCGANDACPAGTTCKTYYGIAGAQGPAFKSCEIACDQASKNCPAGSSCVTISDGPGPVCRP